MTSVAVMECVVASILVLGGLGACFAPDAPLASEVASPLTSPSGQGTSYQGISYQGISYQGISYQGTSYDGASYGGGSLAHASISGTALVAWRSVASGTKILQWEQRFPDRVCIWNSTRTFLLGCTKVDLSVSPSPLAGSTWPATFRGADGQPVLVTLRIGASTSSLGAAKADGSPAMHPLTGSGSTCGLEYGAHCGHPRGCRTNCDLWLYDVQVEDGGQRVPLCPAGERAIAVDGTYDRTGARTAGNGQFTFACTNGTIAKCTRWGYRPFGQASRCNHQGVCDPPEPLADYHQACIRAATADYCANGHSFTRNGTLVDIYDYQPQSDVKGFIPRTESLAYLQGFQATAFAWESKFDKYGAVAVDFLRYTELGSLSSPEPIGCPGKFSLPVAGDPGRPSMRDPATWTAPYVSIDSTTVCSHSEHTIGKWLHPDCSPCTKQVFESAGSYSPELTCNSAAGGWSSTCVKAASACAGDTLMTSHSECTTGSALPRYGSACTLRVCIKSPSCCTTGWTSSCVSAANAACTGGSESAITRVGFCAQPLSLLSL